VVPFCAHVFFVSPYLPALLEMFKQHVMCRALNVQLNYHELPVTVRRPVVLPFLLALSDKSW